jgi:MFS family permease
LVKSHVEESLGANPGDAALNQADSVAMGLPGSRVAEREPPSRAHAFRALRHPAYRLLFTAFLVNQLGFWVSHIAIQGLMVSLTDNDASQVGLLFFALFIPAFAFAPIAGVAADRFDRKRMVLGCYVAVALVIGSLAALTHSQLVTPNILLGIALLLGTAFAFSGPANMAIAANSVPEEDLASAVSMQSALNNLTRVLGPALAAPLLATDRYEVGFLIFLVAALSAALLTTRMHVAPYEPEDDQSGILARLRSGLVHARDRRPALPALTTVAVLSLFGVSHAAVMPVFVEDVLGDRSLFAWMIATTGVGATIGALVTGQRRRDPELRTAARQALLYGVALSVFAFTDRLLVAYATQLLVGYFYFSVMTGLQTLIQQIVDEAKRGRVMSLFQVCWAGLVPFGGLGIGLAAEGFGVALAVGAGALVCVLYGAALLILAGRFTPAR